MNKVAVPQNGGNRPNWQYINMIGQNEVGNGSSFVWNGTQEEADLSNWREELAELRRGFMPPITLDLTDEVGLFRPNNDALMFTAVVANFEVARIFVDTGSSVDVIYMDCLKQFNVDFKIVPTQTDIVRLTGAAIKSIGEVVLPVSLGSFPAIAIGSVRFLIMDTEAPFNIILGRPSLNMFQAVVSTFHMKIKFPVNELVGEVRGDGTTIKDSFHCRPYIDQIEVVKLLEKKDPRHDTIGREEERRLNVNPDDKPHLHVLPIEEPRSICLDPNVRHKMVRIGSHLEKEPASCLIEFLRKNQVVFARELKDLIGAEKDGIIEKKSPKTTKGRTH